MEREEGYKARLEDVEQMEASARWARNLVAAVCVVGILVAGLVVSWGFGIVILLSLLAGAVMFRTSQVLTEAEDYTDACREKLESIRYLHELASRLSPDDPNLLLGENDALPLQDLDALLVQDLDALWRGDLDGLE